MIVLPQTPNKMRYRRDKHSREHRDRIADEHKRRQKIAQMMASYEAARGPCPPITLPRVTIQQESE